jgi:glyoxylase-like metal-dependent hydrolase (beta-lactamase superfamily II)
MTQTRDRPGDHSPAPRLRKQEQEPASEEVVEVAPGVLRMQLPIAMPGLGHVNMYGLVDDRGLAVVDPGLPGPKSWRAIKARLRSAGFAIRDIHTVIVTHSHPDHFGGAGRIAREADAELITHLAFTVWTLKSRPPTPEQAEEAERVAAAVTEHVDVSPDELPTIGDPLRDAPSREGQLASVPWGGETPWGGSRHPMPSLRKRLLIRALRLLFVRPDPTRRIPDGERLALAGREWRALHTPGHTLDHLCLYDEEHGVLLSGDHVLPTITPHVAGAAKGSDSLRSYLDTLELVAGLPGIRLGLPAHGHPFDDVPGRVETITKHHEEREQLLREASLALGPSTVRELCREIFPKRYWGVMAESETFAHLEHMVALHAAERIEDGGPFRYVIADG